MVDEQTAKKLVVNLKGLDGWPETLWQREQLGKALMEHCANEDHAERTLATCLRERRFCPTVDRIIAVASSLPRASTTTRRRRGCQACAGTGFIRVSTEGHGTVQRCQCSPMKGSA